MYYPMVLRVVALLLLCAVPSFASDCSSHDNCTGYCRTYGSDYNYCRDCGACLDPSSASPIDGVCPSKCDELPTLYDNGTLAIFNAATIPISVYGGLSYEAACNASDPATNLLFSGVAASSWASDTAALYRMDDRYGATNYYCVKPTDTAADNTAATYAWNPQIVFLIVYESDTSSLVVKASSTTPSGVRDDFMRVHMANGQASTIYTPDAGSSWTVGSGTIMEFGIAEDLESLLASDFKGCFNCGLDAGYTGIDGAQVTLDAHDNEDCNYCCGSMDDGCGNDGCGYDCADADAFAAIDVDYGTLVACAVYETSDRHLTCQSIYPLGPPPTFIPTPSPSVSPTRIPDEPSAVPIPAPRSAPTFMPTPSPSVSPTRIPDEPSTVPIPAPRPAPTFMPTPSPVTTRDPTALHVLTPTSLPGTGVPAPTPPPTTTPTRVPVVVSAVGLTGILCSEFVAAVFIAGMDATIGAGDASFSNATCADLTTVGQGVSISTEVSVALAMAAANGKSVHEHVADALNATELEANIKAAASSRRLVVGGRRRRLDMSAISVASVDVDTFSPTPAPTHMPDEPSAVPIPAPTAAPMVATTAAPGSKSSSSGGGGTMVVIIVVVVVVLFGIGGVAAMVKDKGAAKPLAAPAAAPERAVVAAVANSAAASDKTVELGADANVRDLETQGLTGEEVSEC